MAGTIVASLQCSVVNGAFKDDPNIQPITIVQNAIGGGNPGTVDITTSEADISFGLTTPGFAVIENLDATNYFELGPKSGGVMILYQKVKPGEFAVVRFGGGVTVRGKANAATCKARFRVYED